VPFAQVGAPQNQSRHDLAPYVALSGTVMCVHLCAAAVPSVFFVVAVVALLSWRCSVEITLTSPLRSCSSAPHSSAHPHLLIAHPGNPAVLSNAIVLRSVLWIRCQCWPRFVLYAVGFGGVGARGVWFGASWGLVLVWPLVFRAGLGSVGVGAGLVRHAVWCCVRARVTLSCCALFCLRDFVLSSCAHRVDPRGCRLARL